MHLVVIRNDVSDIALRIKEIDRDYYVVLNRKAGRYEVHNRRNASDTLASVLPYSKLDARAVEYIRRTRIHRINDILSEIEDNNSKLIRSKEKAIIEDVCNKAERLNIL